MPGEASGTVLCSGTRRTRQPCQLPGACSRKKRRQLSCRDGNSAEVGAGLDGIAAAVRGGPLEGAGLWLGEGPAGCLLGLVVFAAQGCQVAGAGRAALVPGGGVVQVVGGGGAAAAGERAGPVPGPDQVADHVGRPVAAGP